MKNLFFLFLIITHFTQSQELGFTEISITGLSQNNINVLVKATTNCGVYLSHEVIVSESNITLNICYNFCGAGIILYPENDFQINLANEGSYNLNIVAYESTDPNNICNFNNIQDTASLSFTMPLSGTVTLSKTDFLNVPKNIFYPNPTTGILNVDNFLGKSIILYDNLGKKIKQFHNLKNNIIDISEFDDGLYFIEVDSLDDRRIEKIILKR